MKVAVLGGGTAGFIAAAHMTRYFPKAQLWHIYDSRIPTIGVGEGTTPRFPLWLDEVTGVGPDEIAERCGATVKSGSYYEGWGSRDVDFVNRFQPPRLFGYHFDAGRVTGIIRDHVRATQMDAKVVSLDSLPDGVNIGFEDGSHLQCDYVLDARGFPSGAWDQAPADPDIIRMDWIPTGRAMVRRLPPSPDTSMSRIVARPHGWIFQIPLREWTSCGYVFNPSISSDEDVLADFDSFLKEEGAELAEIRVRVSFPNFMRRTWFDGRVFTIGNAASFVEPLEATAIGATIMQVRIAQRWMTDHHPQSTTDIQAVDHANRTMRAYVLRNSLFIAWHYVRGSRWNSPFWDLAARSLEYAGKHAYLRGHIGAMSDFLDVGRDLPGTEIGACTKQDIWEQDILPKLTKFIPFGNFSELNFAQVGHGIGYYNANNTSAGNGTHV
ncbi:MULTISPECIES: tryptophan 7-halogenase [unclassified Ruegeria]|uniref:tryptophan 7-halogenase n=1 Tax=unclassified Ruegeria TaxID=2625375 RepID=UPI001ADBC5B5|nr:MULTISPECIES: tryptophan 7-halogenase [unclassified Ruegeria]MBO9413767.1 tryptophan 7-halogenase [Ruegeria sp. R8_1]MBO9417763.1 tryptophan 7-halogenase [Ruegeria sp. R8_2]